MDGAKLRLNLRFTLVGAAVLPTCGVLSTPNCDFLQTPLQVLPALADRLDQKGGRGGADVERLDPPAAGQGDEPVAGVGDAWADPLPLTAEDENGRPREVDRPGRVFGVGVGAPDPVAGLLRLGQPIGQIADAGDLEVLDGARRGLADDGGDFGRAAFGDDDAGGAGELGRAADGAEVARVLDLVEGDQQRVFLRAGPRCRRRRDRGRLRRRRPGGRGSRRAAPAPRARSRARARPAAPPAVAPVRPPRPGACRR